MKFGLRNVSFHAYITDRNGIPRSHTRTSEAGRGAAPISTASPVTEIVEPNRGLRAQQGRNQGWNFRFRLMKEKYQPPVPAMPPELPELPELPNLSSMIFTSLGYQATPVVPPMPITAQIPASDFMNLPNEIHQKILSLSGAGDIKRYRRVSKKAAGIGAEALRHLKVEDVSSLKSALVKFERGGIKSLTLYGSFADHHFQNRELQNLMQSRLQVLEVFDVSTCDHLTLSGISNLIRHMPRLKELKLTATSVREVLVNYFAGNLNNETRTALQLIKHIKFGALDALSDERVAEALTLFPTLSRLDLVSVHQLTDEGLINALSNATQLTHLRINDCIQLSYQGIAAALGHLPNLRHLNLPPEDAIDNESLVEILEQTPQLTHLFLRNCRALSIDGLAEALQRVSGTLISLELCEAEPALADVLAQVPNLERLKLSDIDNLADADLAAALQRVPNLKHLELTNLDDSLTDAGLTAALRHVNELTQLDVNACNALRHMSFPRLNLLKILNVFHNANLQSVILRNLPSLQELGIYGNESLDRKGLRQSLQDVHTTLVALDIADLPQLRNEDLPNFSSFVNLRRLDLSGNPNLTDACLQTLPVLDRLDVLGCHMLTDAALQAVNAHEIAQFWDMPPLRGA